MDFREQHCCDQDPKTRVDKCNALHRKESGRLYIVDGAGALIYVFCVHVRRDIGQKLMGHA